MSVRKSPMGGKKNAMRVLLSCVVLAVLLDVVAAKAYWDDDEWMTDDSPQAKAWHCEGRKCNMCQGTVSKQFHVPPIFPHFPYPYISQPIHPSLSHKLTVYHHSGVPLQTWFNNTCREMPAQWSLQRGSQLRCSRPRNNHNNHQSRRCCK